MHRDMTSNEVAGIVHASWKQHGPDRPFLSPNPAQPSRRLIGTTLPFEQDLTPESVLRFRRRAPLHSRPAP